MRYRDLVLTTAIASVVALGACNRAGGSAPAAADAANKKLASSNLAVAGTEDATAAVVGVFSATSTVTAAGFVTAASTSDMYEVQAGKIAEHRSTSPALRKFAAKMVQDHTASTAKLKKVLAGSRLVATPAAELDERRKGLINNLNAAKPVDFDRIYIDQQVVAHQEAATLFRGYVVKGFNAAVKTFAKSTLPTIQAHLAMARQMQDAAPQ